MIREKRRYGQFYTTFNPFEVSAFKEWLAEATSKMESIKILEPFAGNNHLPAMIGDNFQGKKIHWHSCDLKEPLSNKFPSAVFEIRDTMTDYPKGYSIAITNPPYLARNSATRRKISYPDIASGNLYIYSLEIMLESTAYVAAIVPESFINQELLKDRLKAVIYLTKKMFSDTDYPVCLALFSPKANEDIKLYDMDNFLGGLRELKGRVNLIEGKDNNWKFNDSSGKVGIICIDGNKRADIRFLRGEEISVDQIRHSSRTRTRVSGLDEDIDLDIFIDKCNEILAKYREVTKDVFLTSFKGLRADGYYRRRLDFKTSREIMNTALFQTIDLARR